MHSRKKAFTLLELLIAVSLLSIIGLGLGSINVFSSFHVTSSSRRQQVQNEVYIAVEHMNRWLSRAIGNESINGTGSVLVIGGGTTLVRAYVDSNATGGPGDGIRDTVNDHWIRYRVITNIVEFCSDFNVTTSTCNVVWEVVSRNFDALTWSPCEDASGLLVSNSCNINYRACWDPAVAESVDNPCVTMESTIFMPSVTVN